MQACDQQPLQSKSSNCQQILTSHRLPGWMDDDDDEYEFNGQVEGNDAGSNVGFSTDNHSDDSKHNNHLSKK